MQDSNRQSKMTKSSRGNNVGRRKKGRPEKYQKAMENFMGQFHDIEVNIANLSQQFHALHGHISKINRLQKRYSLWRWHRRCQWQWRWRWPFRLTVRRQRYLTLRKKETLGKRNEAATQISSHYRYGGLAGSTSQENVEAVVESYHSETNRFLCNDSPKGQDQPGGSAQGMGPDYPLSIEVHTSKEGHIDSPNLSNESRGSSLLFPNHEESFSPEATPRTGNSPNEPQEGGEHGQICPPNCLSKSPTFPGICSLNCFKRHFTLPMRLAEYVQICLPNEMSNIRPFPRRVGDESYHSETNRFLCNDSPKGQDQPGGSAQGMGPDYPLSIEVHTSKEGHIDSPNLSNESRGSSLLFPNHEESFSLEATPRTGNSPNEPQEGGEHGQICPPNCLSKSPTFPGICSLNCFKRHFTLPMRLAEYVQICLPNEMSNIRPFPRRVGEYGQIAPPECVSVSQTSSKCCWWAFPKTPSGSYSYSPTSPKRHVCNAVSPNSCISYTPEIPVLGYYSWSSSDKNDSKSSKDSNEANFTNSPLPFNKILWEIENPTLDGSPRGPMGSHGLETKPTKDANGQILPSVLLKEPQEDTNHNKYSDPAGSGGSVIIIEDSNEEVTDLNQANHTKFSGPAGSRDSVIVIEDSSEEVTELNQAEGSQVIESNDQAEGSHPTEVSKINEDSQFQEHGSHGRASLEPLPPGLPPNPLNWSVQDVILFLTHSGSTTFKVLADVCELYEIDGLALLLLDCEVLTRHMGIQEGPALTLYNFIKALRGTFFK